MKAIDPNLASEDRGRRLSDRDTFRFGCHAALNCFNRCCRNLNLFLYPYDVVRLKRSLGLSSDQFLDRHVDLVMREGNHFPDVLLRMADNEEKTCPFLSDGGCRVYLDRPDTCRNFPVEHGLYFRENAPPQEVHFFRPPDFCLGQHEASEWTVGTWEADQAAKRHGEMTRRWSEIKRLFDRNPWGAEGPYGPKGKMAFMAAYNVDRFREFIYHSSFLKRFRVPRKVLDKARKGDTTLMLLGFEWIRIFVFGIASSQIRPR
ncbi:MAG: YkgJ family cysteine cluster protein [Desulfobacterales bacterium]